jgi:hypothetical protein
MEKIIDKIRKLLEMTTENGCSENEAMVAALKAQKLMAEHDIDIVDVKSDIKSMTEEIGEERVDTTLNGHFSTKWKIQLASIIAANFRCKVYGCGTNIVVFYGHKSDAKIAGDVFKFLFMTGTKLGVKYYRDASKAGKYVKGAATTYLLGFCKGIEEVLGKQCRALMIITSPEVEEGWLEKSKNFRHKTTHYNQSYDKDTYEQGRTDGRATANARSLEGGE